MYKMHSSNSIPHNIHPYDTRACDMAVPFFHRLSLTQKSLSYKGPSNWNKIPNKIKNSTSLNIFKNKYKRYLLSKYSF